MESLARVPGVRCVLTGARPLPFAMFERRGGALALLRGPGPGRKRRDA